MSLCGKRGGGKSFFAISCKGKETECHILHLKRATSDLGKGGRTLFRRVIGHVICTNTTTELGERLILGGYKGGAVSPSHRPI